MTDQSKPEQTRMEQFRIDYPEIAIFLNGICEKNTNFKLGFESLAGFVNAFSPESRVRQELRVALETIADYQEQIEQITETES